MADFLSVARSARDAIMAFPLDSGHRSIAKTQQFKRCYDEFSIVGTLFANCLEELIQTTEHDSQGPF